MKYRPQSHLTGPFGALVNDFFNRDIGQFLGHDDAHRNTPGVNIVERKDRFDLELLAPGFAKEDITVRIEDDVLTISAGRRNETLQEGERFTRREFSYGAFERSFRLPETVNAEGIRANHRNGVLVVSIPKAEAAKPKRHEIAID